jgi:glycosyltransferase involved in cell wall biosynthesis
MAASWPSGYLDAPKPFADLFLGCAEAVTREVAARLPGANTKTVWNGIDPRRARVAECATCSEGFREKLGWDGSDFVLISVANPRSQKRLERLPEIMARIEERLAPRRVRLIVAGEAASGSPDGRDAMLKFETEVDLWHARKAIHWSSGIEDIAPLLAAADAFVSTSAVEGLSLAQLEALAAGLPVVATNVGGAREVADRSDRMFLVSKDADAEAFAKILARLAAAPPPKSPALPKAFTRERMAARSNLLYRGLLVRANRRIHPREPVWVLTNNFSTGGAQSSARRLLTGLAARGHYVRAATIEELQERVSPGREALNAAGIPVTAITPGPNPEVLVAALLDALGAHPPRAVLFWNVITPVKVLIADALAGITIFDVSPGEMYFQSLDRFFAAVPAGLPIKTPRDYGKMLEGVIVKYSAEAARAKDVLGTRVQVIPNGVPRGQAVSGRRKGERLVIGTAARLSPDKRLDQLLAALHHIHARLPKYEVRIAGGPEAGNLTYTQELRRLAGRLPVKWCGKVDDIPSFMAGLDIFAMISEPAGCPNASLEAMAARLPIVATDHGGANEQVTSGVNGLLVPRGNPKAFGEALLSLANDSAMCERMGEASRLRADSVFGMERMLDLYSAVLGLAAPG